MTSRLTHRASGADHDAGTDVSPRAAARALPVGSGPVARGRRSRPVWPLLVVALLGWSAAGVLGSGPVVNTAGWPSVTRFLAGAVRPETDGAFLRLTAEAAGITLGYAVLGTVVSLLAAGPLAVLASSLFWQRTASRSGNAVRRLPPGLLAARAGLAVPRGLHEAVWGLLLVNVLGLDPLVAILAIAIPYAAITAKVYADMLDEAPPDPYRALLWSGSSRPAALLYGLLPLVGQQMLSYAFYRFECSIRSAVVLGIVGAGGLGFQLTLSFASLRYDEMWTLLYAILALCAVIDVAGSALRRRLSPRPLSRTATTPGAATMDRSATTSGAGSGLAVAPARNRVLVGALIVLAAATVASWVALDVSLAGLTAAQTRAEVAALAAGAWPPAVDREVAAALLSAALQTLQMTVVATALAGGCALAVAVVAARPPGLSPPGWIARALGLALRLGLLAGRAVPPPVWAFVLLLVLYPGPLPGALALAVYTTGVLGRLILEALESADVGPARALELSGARPAAVLGYGLLPGTRAQLAAYVLYRGEVNAREAVVVGMVGAGGLGVLLTEQTAAFNWAGMTATLGALIIITLLLDGGSAVVRRRLR